MNKNKSFLKKGWMHSKVHPPRISEAQTATCFRVVRLVDLLISNNIERFTIKELTLFLAFDIEPKHS